MIVTEEMQDTVDQQGLQLLRQRTSAPLRLARGRLDGDHHLSEQGGLQGISERK